MSELKNCPFCGDTAALDTFAKLGNGGCDLYTWQIICAKCKIQTPIFEDSAIRDKGGIRLIEDGRLKAITAWNRRVGEEDMTC